MTTERVECDECEWVGISGQLLRAENPFDPSSEIVGCPACKSVDQFTMLCEIEGCSRHASCGWPDGDEYRQTCYEHRRADDNGESGA